MENNEGTETLSSSASAIPTTIRIKEEKQDEEMSDEIFEQLMKTTDEIPERLGLLSHENDTSAPRVEEGGEQMDLPIRIKEEVVENSDTTELLEQPIKKEPVEAAPVVGIKLRLKKESELMAPPVSDREKLEASSQTPDDVPEDFFDELLLDRIEQHVEEDACNHIEMKYSEKLKILKNLEEQFKEKKKKEKKLKKSKKKSKHSNDSEHGSEHKRTRRLSRNHSGDLSNISDHEMPSSSKRIKTEDVPLNDNEFINKNHLRRRQTLIEDDPISFVAQVKDERQIHPFLRSTRLPTDKLPGDDDFAEEASTPQEKLQLALEKCSMLRRNLKKKTWKSIPLFQFTNTIRKLPASTSLYLRKDYEDRSPLNAVNNVEYAFSTKSTQINLFAYGLERMPKSLVKSARLMAMDYNTLYEKMQGIQIPPTVSLKRKRNNPELLIKEEIQISGTTMFRTTSCQTDCSMLQKNPTQDMAIQVDNFELNPKGTYLLKMMDRMSEKQQFALYQFAKILLDPKTNETANHDMTQRLLKIYRATEVPLEPIHNPEQIYQRRNKKNDNNLYLRRDNHQEALPPRLDRRAVAYQENPYYAERMMPNTSTNIPKFLGRAPARR